MTRKQGFQIRNISMVMLLLAGSVFTPFDLPLARVPQNVCAAESTTVLLGAESLSTELETAKAVDTSGMTKASVDFFQKVIDYTEQVSNGAASTKQDIEKQTQLLVTAREALREKPKADAILDGEYTVSGRMWHATSDQPSMGNASLVQPMKVIRKGDSTTLQLEFVPLTTGLFTGYLYQLYYFPSWTDDSTIPYKETPVELDVTEYYEGVYDSYNDPQKGLDAKAKGKLYPHYMTMPIEWSDSQIWVQVYVPVMEAISAGSGLQYAKLQLDWNTLEQVSGAVTDKSSLKERISEANGLLTRLTSEKTFSDQQISMLSAGIAAAGEVLEDMNAAQEEINNTTKALKSAMNLFKEESIAESEGDSTAVNKTGLQMMLLAANGISQRQGYTAASMNNLNRAIENAKAVYDNSEASQTAVDQQTEELAAAIIAMELKTITVSDGIVASGGVSGTQGNDSEEEESSSKTNTESQKKADSDTDNPTEKTEQLNIKKLQDGIYSIQGEMVKIDKKTASMSNEAVNHTLKLAVKKGKYYLSMDFKGLTINSQLGYLGTLKYFKSGYKLDQYGAPNGKLGAVTVDSYQRDSKGELVKDNYGTNYPNQVTFPLISEALKDGYVPLQVFVPIMEAISTGSGTQPVFLKLDFDSLKSATANDKAFQDNKTENSSSANSNINKSSSVSSLLYTASTLPASTGLGDQVTEMENGSLSDDVISTETDSLGDFAMTSLAVSDNRVSVKEDAVSGTSPEVQSDGAGNDVSKGDNATSKRSSISVGMSVLAVLAGLGYKLKGRNIFGRRKEES